MKRISLCYILSIITTLVVNPTSALPVEQPSQSKDDKYYMIFVDNNFSSSNDALTKRQESKAYINELIVEISNIIKGNKDTYQDPEKLEEFQQNSISLRKRNEVDTSLAYEISSLKDRTIIYSYLSEEVAEIVKELPNIVAVTPDVPIHSSGSSSFGSSQQLSDIKYETGWENVGVRENADCHLSILSQGKYNETLIGEYDTNYYYPSSAGKDVDLFIFDTGFNFQHPEFSNKNERTVQCIFTIQNGEIKEASEKDKCVFPEYEAVNHGEMTSDAAAGLVHGVANKANVYGVAISGINHAGISSIIKGLQYVKDHWLRPHRAVFNFSFISYMENIIEDGEMELLNYFEELINEMSEKQGAVFVGGAGNDGVELKGDKIGYPCAFDNVICVGGTKIGYDDLSGLYDLALKTGMNEEERQYAQNQYYMEHPQIEKMMAEMMTNKMLTSDFYEIAGYSNYGEKVDIYAPGFARIEYLDQQDNPIDMIAPGTSLSSPIVAGVAATIISEHPEIKFNSKIMLQYLLDIGQKGIIQGIPENQSNVFINNGKHTVYSHNDVYYGCGPNSGNQTCPDNLICSFEGFCLSEEDEEIEEPSDNSNDIGSDIERLKKNLTKKILK